MCVYCSSAEDLLGKKTMYSILKDLTAFCDKNLPSWKTESRFPENRLLRNQKISVLQ